MSGLVYPIPIEALDRFYFEEVLGAIPPPLRDLLVDPAVLRGEPTGQPPITTVDRLYARPQLFMPWLLDDIFPINEAIRLDIGRGHLVWMISCVLLDQAVDRQMPETPIMPLAQPYLLGRASQVFQRCFAGDGAFWDAYHTCLAEFVAALALESDCVDARARPYTYEVMAEVCAGKAAIFRLVTHALALASGATSLLAVLQPALNRLILADQLGDDARDWEIDYRAGRLTLPIRLALESISEGLAVGTSIEPAEVAIELERRGILVAMLTQAIRLITQIQADLSQVGLAGTKFYTFLGEHLEHFHWDRRHYEAICLLGGLERRLQLSRNP